MKRVLQILALATMHLCLYSQDNLNIEMVSFVAFDEPGNDVWGYVDENGVEYAVVGTRNSTRIFSLEDPASPLQVALIPGDASTWRDFKTFGNFIYVTTDTGDDGVTIIDMTDAPNDIRSMAWTPTLTNENGDSAILETCHNLYIDENGICYLAGCNFQTGIIIVDVATDPLNPSILGYQSNAYAHDVFTQDDIMYTSDIFNGEFSIYDVSDKANPVLLGQATTTSNFTHNAWTNEDGTLLFTTDEVGDANVDAYDISDPTNIRRLDAFKPAATANQGVIPHNTHFINDYLVTSWYTDGIVITDVSSPDNMIQVGAFDTYDGPIGGFNGCWGAYPWLPSGLILASNISNAGGDNTGGLYVLDPNYERASQLRGTITDLDTGEPINMASIELATDDQIITNSDPAGQYRTGVAFTGLIDVTVSHPAYITQTVQVFVENGTVATLDLALEGKIAATILGSVRATADGSAIPFADYILFNEDNVFEGSANVEGQFMIELFQGDYTMITGAWGFSYNVQEISILESQDFTVELERGYQDDFVFNNGWEVSGDAQRGAWELGEPNGTTFQGVSANPDVDAPNDLGIQAYVTGNGGGNAGADDVDNGSTTLTSPPMDLSSFNNPNFHFSYWFFNEGGNSTPNDVLTVQIGNGTEVFEILFDTLSSPAWRSIENFSLDGLLALTDNMTISITTSDFQGTGHLVEAGFDAFLVTDGAITSSEDFIAAEKIAISPNPFTNEIQVDWDKSNSGTATLWSENGREVMSFNLTNGKNLINIPEKLPPGLYILKVVDKENKIYLNKIIKI